MRTNHLNFKKSAIENITSEAKYLMKWPRNCFYKAQNVVTFGRGGGGGVEAFSAGPPYVHQQINASAIAQCGR